MKTALLGSVGAVLLVVGCTVAREDGGGSSASAVNDTTAGRTIPRTGNGNATSTVTRNADAGAATSCYGGQGTCEPTNPTACGKGEACDINGGTGLFECFPPPNEAALGDACDNGAGPFCGQGLACDNGTCKTYCCDDSACAAGTTCQETGAVGEITIKICL